MGYIKDFFTGFIGVMLGLLAFACLVSILVGIIYLIAFGVTKMAMLGADNFKEEFRLFFLVWFGLGTLIPLLSVKVK